MAANRTLLVLVPSLLLGTIGIGYGGYMAWSGLVEPGAAGTIVAEGPQLGQWQMKIDDCESGQREQFFGVILFSSTDRRLAVKVVKPPDSGSSVVVNVPGTDRAEIIHAEQCATFRLDLHRGNSTYNNVWNMHGSLTLDCRIGDDHLSGDVQIKNCH